MKKGRRKKYGPYKGKPPKPPEGGGNNVNGSRMGDNSNNSGPNPIKKKKFPIPLVIGLIGLIFGGFQFYNTFLKSDYQKFKEENMREGTLKFPPFKEQPDSEITASIINNKFLFDSSKYHYPIVKGIYVKNLDKMARKDHITFEMGGNNLSLPKLVLEKGVNIAAITFCNSNAEVWAVARKNRLYFSAKFFDLITSHEIGEMEFNHWKIYLKELLDYKFTDDKLEVSDKEGNIVFSIADVSSNGNPTIALSGYFNSPVDVSIFGNKKVPDVFCIHKSDSEWLKKAEIAVNDIHSVFPKQ